GLYGMVIHEHKRGDGIEYEVEFEEHSLEELAGRLNRFERADEKPFEAVAALSDFNQRAYELFAQPLVQAMSNEASARMLREFHPLRVQNWAFSDLNPWMAWLKPAAEAVRANRQAMADDHPLRQQEQAGAEMLSAGLDAYRAVRDAMTEASFFNLYANLFSFLSLDKPSAPAAMAPQEPPEVRAALASVGEGGYTEAIARLACLLNRKGEPLPLSRLELRKELVTDYADFLPELPPDAWRKTRGQQELITRYAPEQALETLPALLRHQADRQRLHALAEKLRTDERLLGTSPTAEQAAMLGRIRAVLAPKPERGRAAGAPLTRAS
ncbi:DUF3141 domain-containing protein, partial [Cupriavidus nantongensis]|uniref:DUF3141 domain-containing protein n=2 Tax=Burkholderiaceae TaxID=119060 RepID=UPI00358E867E